MSEFTVLVGVLCVIAFLNGVVTWFVLRSDMFEHKQMIVQVSLIWLLPVIGAVVIAGFMRYQGDASTRDPDACPDTSEKAAVLDSPLTGTTHH